MFWYLFRVLEGQNQFQWLVFWLQNEEFGSQIRSQRNLDGVIEQSFHDIHSKIKIIRITFLSKVFHEGIRPKAM